MSEKLSICPVCENGELQVVTYSDTFKHNGQPLQVHALEGCECTACGADPVLPDQIKRNQARIADAKRRADGLLSGGDIVQIRDRLNLTQRQAAEIFGGGPKAFAKYERGEVVQSHAMDSLLRLVDRYPNLLYEVGEFRGLEPTHAIQSDGTYRGQERIRVARAKSYNLPRTVNVITPDHWRRGAA